MTADGSLMFNDFEKAYVAVLCTGEIKELQCYRTAYFVSSECEYTFSKT